MNHALPPHESPPMPVPPAAAPDPIHHDDPDVMPALIALNTGSGTPNMAKTWYRDEEGIACKPYDNAYIFKVYALKVYTLISFLQALIALKGISAACVIRGALQSHANHLRAMRRSVDYDGIRAPFSECRRRWMLLDFDKFVSAEFPDPAIDPHGCAEAVRARLPAGIRGVACFWSYSSSTGIKPGKMGIHLWFLLEIPLGWREAEALMRACGADTAMSRPVQVHYTAKPVFEAPLEDPLPKRYGVLPGVERVPAEVITELMAEGDAMRAEELSARVEAHSEKARARRTTGMSSSGQAAKKGTGAATRQKPESAPTATGLNKGTSDTAKEEAAEVPEGMIGDGHRHEHLKSMAGYARSRGLDAEGLRVLLTTENTFHCAPSLPEGKAEAMAQSFARYEPKRVQPTVWHAAVAMAAGLIRHDACDEAIIAIVTYKLDDPVKAQRIVEALLALPLCHLACAEASPALVIEQEAQP